jgi:protein SCO1/2
VAAATVVSVTLAGSDRSEARYRGSPPPGEIVLPDFELHSYTGEPVRRADLAGKVVVVTFLETKCKEACPLIAWQIARAVEQLSGAARKRASFIAISTHPEDDTPANVRRFLADRHALGKLDYLVGAETELWPVWSDFSILSALDSGDADTHSASVRVFDPAGTWVSTLHSGVDLTPANLAHDVLEAARQG